MHHCLVVGSAPKDVVTHFTRRPAELLFLVGENPLLTHKRLPICFNRHSILVHVGAAHLLSNLLLNFDTKLELRLPLKANSLVTRPALQYLDADQDPSSEFSWRQARTLHRFPSRRPAHAAVYSTTLLYIVCSIFWGNPCLYRAAMYG